MNLFSYGVYVHADNREARRLKVGVSAEAEKKIDSASNSFWLPLQ